MAVLDPLPEPALPLPRALAVIVQLFEQADAMAEIPLFETVGSRRYWEVITTGEKLLLEAGYPPHSLQRKGMCDGHQTLIAKLRDYATELGRSYGFEEFQPETSASRKS